MDKLKSFIKERSLKGPGCERLLSSSDAQLFVELCRMQNFKVGGFDGFRIHSDGIEIEQSLSADYSDVTTEKSYKLALDFLAQHNDTDIGYEMVYVKKL